MNQELAGEWWGVWCEHTDGRRYWLGDASQTKWTQQVAEGAAAHLSRYEHGTFTAKPLPLASKEPDPHRYHRGLIIAKGSAHDVHHGARTFFVEVRCEDDGACSDVIVVSEELHNEVCIAGLGQDWMLVYREGDEPRAERA